MACNDVCPTELTSLHYSNMCTLLAVASLTCSIRVWLCVWTLYYYMFGLGMHALHVHSCISLGSPVMVSADRDGHGWSDGKQNLNYANLVS